MLIIPYLGPGILRDAGVTGYLSAHGNIFTERRAANSQAPPGGSSERRSTINGHAATLLKTICAHLNAGDDQK